MASHCCSYIHIYISEVIDPKQTLNTRLACSHSVSLSVVLKHDFTPKVTSLSCGLCGYAVFPYIKGWRRGAVIKIFPSLYTKCADFAIWQVIGCGIHRFLKLSIIMCIKLTEVLQKHKCIHIQDVLWRKKKSRIM